MLPGDATILAALGEELNIRFRGTAPQSLFVVAGLEGQQGGEQKQTLSKRSESRTHPSSSIYSAFIKQP